MVIKDDRRVRVPRQAITDFEISTGSRRQPAKGMLIGAVIGAVVMGALGLPSVACSDCPPSHQGQAALLGAGAGAAYGVGIGALVKTDRWSRVALEHVQVGLGPTRGRSLGLALSVAF